MTDNDAANREPNAFKDFISESSFKSPVWRDASPAAQHLPFYFWLVETLRPAVVVDIGLSNGSSFFAFCEAIRAQGLSCQCHGLVSAKDYPKPPQNTLKAIQDFSTTHFNDFSHIGTLASADAVPQKIDLLHIASGDIDETSVGDVASLIEKMSPSSVLLLEGSNSANLSARIAEMRKQPLDKKGGFAFLHGDGLTVLPVGSSFGPPLSRLLSDQLSADTISSIRAAYCRLGLAVADRAKCELNDGAGDEIWRLQEQIRRQSHLAGLAARKNAEVYSLKNEIQILKMQRSFYLHLRNVVGRTPLGPRLRRLRSKLAQGR